ncbi:MAG: 2TM domain-containing protein [Saprospiraceae bacterium]|nr:2TM domain-containing protein [Saprospiraceae bacterium]
MNEKAYKEARKRVKKKKDFYEHFTTYVVMSVFFLLLNLVTAPGQWWFYWPILGWGFGVVFHYLDVFGIPGLGTLSRDWEERAMEEEIKKIEGKRNGLYASDDYEELTLKELPRQKRSRWSDDELV